MTCDYHQKGFARKYDKNRHFLTHYKGTLVCDFCPGSGSAAERSFNRADVFKRHLTSMHGVESYPQNNRPIGVSAKEISIHATGKCSTCSATFNNAQDFYEHLDDCVLRVVHQAEPSEAINERHLSRTFEDPAVLETLRRHMHPVHPEVARASQKRVVLRCTQCDEHPEGFRREHDLRRHTERFHTIIRKAYQCVDISPDKKFLAKCKACTSGKKYNAYYNAAAHLRRSHFNPRMNKASKTEPRRGRSGGLDPPLEVLMTWMKEVEEPVTSSKDIAFNQISETNVKESRPQGSVAVQNRWDLGVDELALENADSDDICPSFGTPDDPMEQYHPRNLAFLGDPIAANNPPPCDSTQDSIRGRRIAPVTVYESPVDYLNSSNPNVSEQNTSIEG